MKTIRFFQIALIPILYILLSAHDTVGQDSDISDIRNQYSDIRNGLDKFQTRQTAIEGESAEGGMLTAYIDDSLIRLIVAEYFGETGKRVIEYYYANQHVFFILDVVITYNRPVYYDSLQAAENHDQEWHDPSKSKKSEDRLYFKNDRLIRWIDKTRQTIPLNSDQFKFKETEWIGESNKVLSVFFSDQQ